MKKVSVYISIPLIIFITVTVSHSVQYWAKTYGESGNETAYTIKQTSDGGFIVVGETDSFGVGYRDFLILKLDSNGNVTWQKTYGGTNVDGFYKDTANSIHQTSDGGYIMIGLTGSFGAPVYDILVLKLDSNGDIDWQKRYGGYNSDWSYSILSTSDGGYIVAGGTDSFGAGGKDRWLLKLNSDGGISWQKTYGGSGGNDGAFYIQQTYDRGFGNNCITGCYDVTIRNFPITVKF